MNGVVRRKVKIVSQFALPLCTDALVVKLAAVGPVTASVCEAGEPPPTVPLKLSEVGVMVRGTTARVTGTVIVVYESPLETLSEIAPV